MKIYVLIPVLDKEELRKRVCENYKSVARPDTQISVVGLEKGSISIESEYDEEVAAPWILEKAKEAEEKGVDAIIIDCMVDPCLNAVREIVGIPVIGPCLTTMAIASTIGHRFSIVTVLKNLTPLFERRAKMYGFYANLTSVRSIGIPVLDIKEREEEVKAALLAEGRKAKEEGADTIILGCTEIKGMARELQDHLGVPVIDPTIASLKLAEILVDMKLSHSEVCYPFPPMKKREI